MGRPAPVSGLTTARNTAPSLSTPGGSAATIPPSTSTPQKYIVWCSMSNFSKADIVRMCSTGVVTPLFHCGNRLDSGSFDAAVAYFQGIRSALNVPCIWATRFFPNDPTQDAADLLTDSDAFAARLAGAAKPSGISVADFTAVDIEPPSTSNYASYSETGANKTLSESDYNALDALVVAAGECFDYVYPAYSAITRNMARSLCQLGVSGLSEQTYYKTFTDAMIASYLAAGNIAYDIPGLFVANPRGLERNYIWNEAKQRFPAATVPTVFIYPSGEFGMLAQEIGT